MNVLWTWFICTLHTTVIEQIKYSLHKQNTNRIHYYILHIHQIHNTFIQQNNYGMITPDNGSQLGRNM
jgi:hypothetical protein